MSCFSPWLDSWAGLLPPAGGSQVRRGLKGPSREGRASWRGIWLTRVLSKGLGLYAAPAHDCHVGPELWVARFLNFPIQKLGFYKKGPIFKASLEPNDMHLVGQVQPDERPTGSVCSEKSMGLGVRPTEFASHLPCSDVGTCTSDLISRPLSSSLWIRMAISPGCGGIKDNACRNPPAGNQ